MKTKLLILVCLFFQKYCKGQNIFWSDNFNHIGNVVCVPGSSTLPWTITSLGAQGANANDWYIFYPVEANVNNCFVLNTDTTKGALYIGFGISNCDSAYLGPHYKKGCDNTTYKRAESPLIDCTGKSNITLDFDIMARNLFIYDNAAVELSSDGGSSWTTLASVLNTGYCYSFSYTGFWGHKSYLLPSSVNNNPNVKIGFTWKNNDDCIGSEMSVAVDNIELSVCDVHADIQSTYLDHLCTGYQIPFECSTPFNPSYTYQWIFDNSAIFYGYSTSNSFSSTGRHIVSLIVSDGGGCADTESIVIEIHQSYQLSISVSDASICIGDCINFSSQLVPSSYPAGHYIYHWNFSNGNPSSGSVENPSNICFPFPGIQNVRLTVIASDYSGCQVNETIPIQVDTCGHPTVSLITATDDDLLLCNGDCITYGSNATNATSFSWSFMGGTPSTSSNPTPTVCYGSAGSYLSTSLTVNNSLGSASTSLNAITVSETPSVPILSQSGWNSSTLNDLLIVSNSYNTSTFQFMWYKNTITGWVPVGTINSATYSATVHGLYKLRVENIFNNSCFKESTINVIIP